MRGAGAIGGGSTAAGVSATGVSATAGAPAVSIVAPASAGTSATCCSEGTCSAAGVSAAGASATGAAGRRKVAAPPTPPRAPPNRPPAIAASFNSACTSGPKVISFSGLACRISRACCPLSVNASVAPDSTARRAAAATRVPAPAALRPGKPRRMVARDSVSRADCPRAVAPAAPREVSSKGVPSSI